MKTCFPSSSHWIVVRDDERTRRRRHFHLMTFTLIHEPTTERVSGSEQQNSSSDQASDSSSPPQQLILLINGVRLIFQSSVWSSYLQESAGGTPAESFHYRGQILTTSPGDQRLMMVCRRGVLPAGERSNLTPAAALQRDFH